MAGYYEMRGKLNCWEDGFDALNQGQQDYVMDKKYWMRPGVNRCRENSLGTTCSFYGPMTVPRTTQESFLQGRGQIENDNCPECGVIYLPESVFALTKDEEKGCQNMALQPEFTRQPKSCFNISETETTAYAMMPGAFQKGYVGYDALCDTNIQSRENARQEYRAPPQTPGQKMTNYGSYNTYYNSMGAAAYN